MNDKVQQFIKECEWDGFPMINGAYFVCVIGDKCYYSDDNYYTYQEVYDDYHNAKNKEEEDLRDLELFMEIDMAREDYLNIHGHI